RPPERKDLSETAQIELQSVRASRRQRLDLGAEKQPAIVFTVIQGAYADPVSCQYETLSLDVPERDGKLAIQLFEEAIPILLVGVYDRLGIRACSKGMARREQLLTQLDIVENLAVE